MRCSIAKSLPPASITHFGLEIAAGAVDCSVWGWKAASDVRVPSGWSDSLIMVSRCLASAAAPTVSTSRSATLWSIVGTVVARRASRSYSQCVGAAGLYQD